MEAEVAALRVAGAPQVRETAAARLLQVRDLSARAEVRANLLRRASSVNGGAIMYQVGDSKA